MRPPLIALAMFDGRYRNLAEAHRQHHERIDALSQRITAFLKESGHGC